MAKRGSEWAALRRCILIAQRLLQSDASGADLIAYVRKIEGDDAYPASVSAQTRAFTRDRENLRQRLNVDIAYNQKTQTYTLNDPGPLFALALSARSKRAMALLSRTFTDQAGEHSEIDALVQEILRHLPPGERRFLENAHHPVELDVLQDIDPNGIPARIWETVQRALHENRKLTFNYLSPGYEDRLPRRFEVAAHKLVYQWGHWYLRGYSLKHTSAAGVQVLDPPYLRWRMAYIQNDETLAALPAKLPPITHRPPRIAVHYRLLPRLARGVVSRHFEEMRITCLEDGSAEIRGFTDDAWEAARLLLGYGQYCIVLGGDEVRRLVSEAIRGMYANLYADE